MLFLMILILLPISGYVKSKNAGSALFYRRNSERDCWSEADIAKLRARKSFEELIPPEITPDKVSPKYVKDILMYYKTALHEIDVVEEPEHAHILKQALADTIGAHLRKELLPTVRFAYYAGYIPYRSARKLHNFFNGIKDDLNTQGIGWMKPEQLPQWSNLTVGKIMIGTGKLLDPCAGLVIKRDTNSCINIPTPKLDDVKEPSAIIFPFKTGGLVSLISPRAENFFLQYYTTGSRCILHKSPQDCRHSDFVNFNNQLWKWMKRDIAPHLMDEKLYSAYGGILRVAAAVQSYGKGLSRRNLYDDHTEPTKWIPWQSFVETQVGFDAEWTPQLYIGLVFLAAFAICLLQLCYDCVFESKPGCNCGAWQNFGEMRVQRTDKAQAMTTAEIPQRESIQNNVEQIHNKSITSRTKSSSLGSVRTQKVYDLNENTEKMMAIIMSANEDSESKSSETSSDVRSDDKGEDFRLPSPPKIEASMTQLTINKSPGLSKRTSYSLYSTSTLTRTDRSHRDGRVYSESEWSGTGSSSSRSCSTTSSQTSRRSRSSRDLAWARHVVSKTSTKPTK